MIVICDLLRGQFLLGGIASGFPDGGYLWLAPGSWFSGDYNYNWGNLVFNWLGISVVMWEVVYYLAIW
jgi:hypothetical protein